MNHGVYQMTNTNNSKLKVALHTLIDWVLDEVMEIGAKEIHDHLKKCDKCGKKLSSFTWEVKEHIAKSANKTEEM